MYIMDDFIYDTDYWTAKKQSFYEDLMDTFIGTTGCTPEMTGYNEPCKAEPNEAKPSVSTLPCKSNLPWKKPKADRPKEEGNNPMNTNLNLTVDASAPARAETQVQRDYLLQQFRERYEGWRNDMESKLQKLFKLYAPTKPQSAADLVAAITAGKFTIDQKKIDLAVSRGEYYADEEGETFDAKAYAADLGTFFAMTFTDYPEPDRKGYEAAIEAWNKAKRDTKDLIMVSSPTDGLAAMKALDAWQPTGLPN